MSTLRSGAPSLRRTPVPVLSTPARHLANRFSYGITPALADEIRTAGSHEAWFERQLATAYDGAADNLCDWWPDLHLDPVSLWRRQATGVKDGIAMMQEYARRVLIRRMSSPRQVLEVMTEFWENLLHVPAGADAVFLYRAQYGEMVRARALGRYADLLREAVLHPAMLTYLGASLSTKSHPNENLGRELLELHTVGVGNYTEDDVKACARILTGHRITADRSGATYDPTVHWTGPVKVMGFSDPNQAPDGEALTRRFLDYLAHHPATARRVATRLVRVFVSDEAPPGLVDRLASVYLANDTAMAPVLRALVSDPSFQTGVDAKIRDAERDVVATYRLLGITVTRPRSVMSAANQVNDQAASLGLVPFGWPRPDGKPLTNQAWSSPTRVLGSLGLHWDLANRQWPLADLRFRPYVDWLPGPGDLELREVVDHVARLLLHRSASATLIQACSDATGIDQRVEVGRSRRLDSWAWSRLIAAVLDSPDFYSY